MSIYDIIPTCDDPMSCYTLCALTIIVSMNLFAFSVLYRWSSNENRRIEKDEADDVKRIECGIKKLESLIDGHDDYIDKTTSIINELLRDFAVQENSMQDIKDDIAEIKADLKTLLKRQ